MTKDSAPVAVASRSFSRHPVLRGELLQLFENVDFNESGRQLSGSELVGFLKGHEKAITALERVDEALLAQVPELRVIGKVGVGLDMIDLEAMDRRKVMLGWEGGTNKRSVSELALALMLACLRRLVTSNADLRSGGWKQLKGGTLSGRTVGIVGLGHVGKDLVTLLGPFGCELLGFDLRIDEDFCRHHGVGVQPVDVILKQSDVVSLHLPLSAATRHILDARRIGLMRAEAVLVNTARGGLVDEVALKEALKSGRLGAAGFDVFEEEPPKDAELLALPNFLGIPHIGGSTEEAILAMGRAAIRGLENPRPARDFLPYKEK